MKLVYVAGRFSAPDREGVEANIRAAALVGLEVAKVGGFPLIPHCNTAHPDFERVQPYRFWIDATMAMLCTCEALILVAGWETSSGARGEVAAAQERGMPVFQPGDYEGLAWWLRGSADTIAPPPELPLSVSFEGLPDSRTRCELPTLTGDE
jgi:hypothetical protein